MSQINIVVQNSSSESDTVFRLNPYCQDKHVVCQRLSRMIDSMSADMEAVSMSVYVNGGVGAVEASGTLTGASVVAGDTAQVGSVTFTAIAPGTPTNVQFVVGGTDTITMANLAAAINANPSLVNVAGASSAAAVVTVTADHYGNAGNMIQLVGSSDITASASHLSGGVEPTANVLTFAGLI